MWLANVAVGLRLSGWPQMKMDVSLVRWPSIGRPVARTNHLGYVALQAHASPRLRADGFPVRNRVPFWDRREREELRQCQALIAGRGVRAVLLLIKVAVLIGMPGQGGRRDTGHT